MPSNQYSAAPLGSYAEMLRKLAAGLRMGAAAPMGGMGQPSGPFAPQAAPQAAPRGRTRAQVGVPIPGGPMAAIPGQAMPPAVAPPQQAAPVAPPSAFPTPAQMSARGPEDYRYGGMTASRRSPTLTSGAPVPPVDQPMVGSAAAGGTSPDPAAPQSGAISPADLHDAQNALREYYVGIVGAGAPERNEARMQALALQMRNRGGKGHDWASQLSRGISGAAEGFALYKGSKAGKEYEETLGMHGREYQRRMAELARRRGIAAAGGLEQLGGPEE